MATLREDIASDVADVFVGSGADFGDAMTWHANTADTSGTSIYGAFVEDQGRELEEDDERNGVTDLRRGTVSVSTDDVSGATRDGWFTIGGEVWDVDSVESELEGMVVMQVVRREDERRGRVD